MDISSRPTFRRSLFLILLFLGVLFAFGAASLFTVHAQDVGGSFVRTFASGGSTIGELIVNGPPHPPAGYEAQRAAVDLFTPGQQSAVHSLAVPAYDWVFGCSSVSGGMIAAYYDRNGFPNMYTGPTDGGVMPMDNSIWGTWTDVLGDSYPNIPLTASHQGVDGRSTRGSIDDYWVSIDSSANDPYIANGWTEHTWGDAIGDYMKTSRSASPYINPDGQTVFYNYTDRPDRLTCSAMETAVDPGFGVQIYRRDGTYGRKLFYEARGYTVTDCYNQNVDANGGGFTLAMYKAEIDAGRPVMINLQGHTVVGIGYDDASSTIYINDTWDHLSHSMTWGGSYSGRALLSVSIVNLQPLSTPPAAFTKNSPASGSTGISNLTLSWQTSTGATSYEYCIDTSSNNSCDATWVSMGANTSVLLNGLSLGNHSWQVRARNTISTTEADSGTWWSFTVVPGLKVYLPLITKPVPPPGSFNKSTPANGATGQSSGPTLSWGSSSGAAGYEYCIGTGACSAGSTWTSTLNTSVPLGGLAANTTYYWQVRANNSGGTTYADGGTGWSFTTGTLPAGCGGPVNCDFEAGSSGWAEYSQQGSRIILSTSDSVLPLPVPPHGGSYAAWLGGLNNEISYIQQQVTISAGAPFLVYWHWINSSDVCGYDFGGVLINNIVVDQYNLCSSTNTNGWVTHSLDLSGYAGQSVTLQIRVETDSSDFSAVFVDDVSFRASAGAMPGEIVGPYKLDPTITKDKQGIVASGKNPQDFNAERYFSPR